MPTPRTSDANGAGLHGTGGADLRTAVADSQRAGQEGAERAQGQLGSTPFDWGDYEPAIRRWELILDREVPYPVTLGPGRKHPRVTLCFTKTWERFIQSVNRQTRASDYCLDLPHSWDQKLLDRWFVEWMMGHPEGSVASRLSRRPALGALGDSVVPQQAFAALSMLSTEML